MRSSCYVLSLLPLPLHFPRTYQTCRTIAQLLSQPGDHRVLKVWSKLSFLTEYAALSAVGACPSSRSYSGRMAQGSHKTTWGSSFFLWLGGWLAPQLPISLLLMDFSSCGCFFPPHITLSCFFPNILFSSSFTS